MATTVTNLTYNFSASLSKTRTDRRVSNIAGSLPNSSFVTLRSSGARFQRLSVRSESESSVAEPVADSSNDPKTTAPQKKSPFTFVEEMRIRAMKLHTRDQSNEGEKESREAPLAKWQPTKKGYVQFLVESKAVYDAMEKIIQSESHPIYAPFRSTGLERSQPLDRDLAWFQSEGEEIPPPSKIGSEYAEYLTQLSESDPPAFLCHFYNVYFAHSAGGKMIGKKVASMILEGRELEFYKWDSDIKELLSAVKEKINQVSTEWTREEKDRCLEETEKSFKYSGSILKLLVS